jgi:O-antigen/teichoic acid export membrane protein
MKTVSHVFGTKVVDYLLKFTTSVLIARYLGPSDKGILSFATLVVTWTVMLGNLSLMDANIFLMGSRKFEQEEATPILLVMSILSGLFYGSILLCLVWFHWVNWPVGDGMVFCILLLTIPVSLVLNNSTTVIQGLGWFTAFNVLTVAASATFFTWVLIVIFVAHNRLLGVVSALVGSNFLSAVAVTIYLMKRSQRAVRLSLAYLKAALTYGLRSHLRLCLSQLSARLDQYVLGVLLPPAYLGWYATAVGLREGLLLVPESISVVLFPWVARNQSQAAVLTARVCRVTLAAMAAASLIAGVMSRPVIGMIYGARYLPAVAPFYWLLAAGLFQAVSRVLINYIYGIGRPQLSAWSSAACAVVSVGFIFPLVKSYGMIGAALTTLLAYAAGAMVDLVIVRRLSRLPVSEFLVIRKGDFSLKV